MTAKLFARATRVRVLTMIAAVLAVAAIVWAVVASSHRGATDGPAVGAPMTAARMKDMPGMKSMSGMNMSSGGNVTLSADQVRQFGVTFGTADVRTMTAATRATGVVTFDETKVTQVASRIGGFVERLYVNATGQRVSAGQPLLEIYSPELVAAQQELLLAGQLQRDIGRSGVPGVPGNSSDLVAASRRRLQLWDISDRQIDEILKTGRVRRTLTLHAPSSGVVVQKNVLQGQSITVGEPLYTIANLSDVWVDVQLREGDAAAVRSGSGADIDVTGVPGRSFKGRVSYIYPTLDSASRAIRARVEVSNGDGLLKPGMYATVRLSTPSRAVLTVPSSAILRTGERNVVFMDMGKGVLMPMDVDVGATVGDYTEILSGLKAGDRVVTSAQYLLDSESNLGEVMKSMLGQMR